jgi:predicted amidohydrolase
MFEQLNAATWPSVWGILLIVIILIAIAANSMAKRKADKNTLKPVEPHAEGIRIAMCQITIFDGDRKGNFVRIENAIVEAKNQGADIACFPESAILGWLNPDAHIRACTIPGPDSDLLSEMAKKYKIHLCIGLEEKDGARLYNSALLIDDQGKILLRHRQINIAQKLMSPPYTAGADSDIGAANTKFGKIGLLVCVDTHNEGILDRMAALKPNLLLVPYGYAEQEANWPRHGQELQRVVVNTAKRTQTTVVGTNPVGEITKGPWAGRVYGGQSVAADKTGKIIAVAKDRDRDIAIVSINPAK